MAIYKAYVHYTQIYNNKKRRSYQEIEANSVQEAIFKLEVKNQNARRANVFVSDISKK